MNYYVEWYNSSKRLDTDYNKWLEEQLQEKEERIKALADAVKMREDVINELQKERDEAVEELNSIANGDKAYVDLELLEKLTNKEI